MTWKCSRLNRSRRQRNSETRRRNARVIRRHQSQILSRNVRWDFDLIHGSIQWIMKICLSLQLMTRCKISTWIRDKSWKSHSGRLKYLFYLRIILFYFENSENEYLMIIIYEHIGNDRSVVSERHLCERTDIPEHEPYESIQETIRPSSAWTSKRTFSPTWVLVENVSLISFRRKRDDKRNHPSYSSSTWTVRQSRRSWYYTSLAVRSFFFSLEE